MVAPEVGIPVHNVELGRGTLPLSERFQNRAAAKCPAVWYGASTMQIFNKQDEAAGSGIDKPDPKGLGQKVAAGLRSLLKEDDTPSGPPTQDTAPIAIDAELVDHADRVIRTLKEMD